MAKILTVFGTRPEVIKLAPFVKAVEADQDCISVSCATTQHRELQNDVMKVFGLTADYDLDIMREHQDLFHITSSLLDKLKVVLEKEAPDYVVVQGDTTTAFAAALSSFYKKIPVVHIEAGLRTWNVNDPYPEEANRQLISRIATLHMAPTSLAVNNLAKEGVVKNVFQVGNTIVDALQFVLANQEAANDKKVLITVHRRENFGDRLKNICQAVTELTRIYPDYHFVWPVHPNPNIKNYVYQNMSDISNLNLCAPLSYTETLKLINTCTLVLSDSGGIQEEACILGKNIIVLRDETERPEVVTAGVGILVGSDQSKILLAMKKIIERQNKRIAHPNIYGDPGVSRRIVEVIKNHSKK